MAVAICKDAKNNTCFFWGGERMKQRVLISICLLILCHGSIHAAEYIVSPTGNDNSGTGSMNAPYRTIQHVLDNVAASGDTITLKEGTYVEEVRIRKPAITLRSMDGERATIHMPPNLDPYDSTVPVTFDVESHGSRLQRVEVTGGFYGIFFFSQWDWDETPQDNETAKNIVIEDCIIHDTGRDAIKLPAGCDDITIRRCEIYRSGIGYPEGTPDDDKNAEGIDVVNGDRILVQDCYIHDTATTGIYIKGGSQDSIIERCKIERCGGMGIGVGFDTSTDYFDLVVNPGYYENIRGTVRNCLVVDTNHAGIGMYASKDALVYNNTIVDTAKIYHSPIYFGLSFQDWDEDAGRPANVNPLIMNNIVFQDASIDSPCISIRYADELGGMSGLEGEYILDNNLYFKSGGSCYFEDNRPGKALYEATFSQWQSHMSAESRSMEKDPLLDGTHRLTATSPCIDAGSNGVTGGLPTTDLDESARIQNGIVDLGAFEYSDGSGDATAIPPEAVTLFDPAQSLLSIAVIDAPGLGTFAMTLRFDPASATFIITYLDGTPHRSTLPATFDLTSGILHIPMLRIGGADYFVDMKLLAGSSPAAFGIVDFGVL